MPTNKFKVFNNDVSSVLRETDYNTAASRQKEADIFGDNFNP